MAQVVEVNILPIVKLFRKLKRLSNYQLELFIPEGSANVYLAIAKKRTLIALVFCGLDCISSRESDRAVSLPLPSHTVTILQNITLKEAACIWFKFTKEGCQLSITANAENEVVEEYTIHEGIPEEEMTRFLAASFDGAESLDNNSLQAVLAAIGTMPFDSNSLYQGEYATYISNEECTRVVRTADLGGSSTFALAGLADMYNILGELKVDDVMYSLQDSLLHCSYTRDKTPGLGEVLIYRATPTSAPLRDKLASIETELDTVTYSHKSDLTPAYIASLYTSLKAEASTVDKIPFLTLGKKTWIHHRDISWLHRMKCSVPLEFSKDSNTCKLSLQGVNLGFITLYTEE